MPVTVTVRNAAGELPAPSVATIGITTLPSSFTCASSMPPFTVMSGVSATGRQVRVNGSLAWLLLSAVSNSPSLTGVSVLNTMAFRLRVPV